MSPALVAVALAAVPAAQDVVARVDAVAISRADVVERRAALERAGRSASPAELLNRLLDEALLAAQARRDGLDRDPAVRAQLASERRRLLAKAFVADTVSRSQLPEETLRSLYHQSGDSAKLVLVKLATREEATASLARVQKGGDLAAEAARGVDPALAATGGKTGLRTRGELDPALAEVVFRAPAGELVGPVQLKLGWGVARVIERTIADEAGFAARRDSIAAFAREQLTAETRRHLGAQLKAKAGVALDEAFLRALGNRSDATPDELDHVLAIVKTTPIRYREIQPAIAQASATSGHFAGPTVKISFAQTAIEEALLAAAGAEHGLESSVAAAYARVERAVLARAAAIEVGSRAAPGDIEAAIRSRIVELRSRSKIQVDEAALAAAASHPASAAR